LGGRRSRLGVNVRCRLRGEFLQRLKADLQLRDLELQLLAGAAVLPAPQPGQLQLQVLDLQAMRTHQALQIRYVIRQVVGVAHALIIRAMPQHARDVGNKSNDNGAPINTYYIW